MNAGARCLEQQGTRKYPHFIEVRSGIENRELVEAVFAEHKPQRVNLAAQAGVRYSLANPYAYVESNFVGFLNILEGCRHHDVEHLVFASSSSVYGSSTKTPFSAHQSVDHPLSLYAACKKGNELMAHTYSHLLTIPTTGLRFFTVVSGLLRRLMVASLLPRSVDSSQRLCTFFLS